MILLPVSLITCLSADELEMILAHELAHVRRWDMWVNLAQRVAEAVLFFNPALWYLSRRTSVLREYCCDELTCRAVAGSAGEMRARYASALLRIVELARPALGSRLSTLDHPIALAAAGRSPSELRRRVARLFNEPLREPVRLSRGGLLVLGVLIAVLLVVPTAWHSAADTAAAPTAITVEDRESMADSRAWHILSQADTNGLLLGLPERLGKTLLPSRQATPMWYGVNGGGSITLDVQVDGDAKGEITIGFFANPRWWLAEPVQVRQVVGPGKYTFNRLIPGKYQLGAMFGAPPKPVALGVHAKWPVPVEITAGRAATARVLLSTKFRNEPAGHSGLEKGFAGQWEKMDPTRLVTVCTIDAAGQPIPFCRVTFVDRGDERHVPPHGREADAGAPAGDDGDLAVETSCHGPCPFLPRRGRARSVGDEDVLLLGEGLPGH